MKNLYFVITFLLISFSYGQDTQTSGDIDGFKLYPNPVIDGKVFISTSDNAPKQIVIYDVLGMQVLDTKISGTELLLNDLDAGVYILRVFQKNNVATRKLIVK